MASNTISTDFDFERALNQMPGLVWSSRPDGCIDFLNARWLEATGMSLEAAQGWGWQDAIHPEDRSGLVTYWRGVLGDARSGEFEARLRNADGSYRWYLFRAEPWLDAEGRVLRWYGQTTDIDARKRAELMVSADKQLLESIARGRPLPEVLDALCRQLETIIEHSYASVLLLDRDGHRVRHGASPSLPRSFAELVEGRTIDNGIGPCAAALLSRAPAFRAYVDPAMAPPHMSELVQLLGPLHCASVPFFSSHGEPLGALGLYVAGREAPPWRADIHAQLAHIATIAVERALSIEATQRSERHLAEAQKVSQTGSFLWNPHTQEIYWSEEVYRIYGMDPSVAVTLEMALALCHPEDVEIFVGVAQRAAVKLEPTMFQHRLVLPDGTIRWLEVRIRPATDSSWEYVGTARDITEHKLAETRVHEMQDELADVTRRATLGELAASIAHELNQPLTGIVLNANTCVRWLNAATPNVDEARAAVERIVRDGKRAGEVISRLRALFRKTDGPRGPVDVNEAIEDVLVLVHSELQKHRVTLRTELQPDLPPALGHRVQVQQVALNLIVNANEALAAIEERPRTIVVSSRLVGDEIQVRIEDSGCGIAAEDPQRVFEAFYTRKQGGMGMGLAVSRTIIDNHGGRLWVEPQDGPGATFAFSLLPHP